MSVENRKTEGRSPEHLIESTKINMMRGQEGMDNMIHLSTNLVLK